MTVGGFQAPARRISDQTESATGRGTYPHQEETPMADESYTGEAYCVKCKEKREFTGHVEETNGRRFAKGICPVCGTKVTRILGKA